MEVFLKQNKKNHCAIAIITLLILVNYKSPTATEHGLRRA